MISFSVASSLELHCLIIPQFIQSWEPVCWKVFSARNLKVLISVAVFFFSPPAAFVLSLTPDVTILGRPQIVRMFSVTHYSSGSFTGQTEVSKAIRWERNGFDKVLRLAVVAIWTAGAVRLTVLEEPRRM